MSPDIWRDCQVAFIMSNSLMFDNSICQPVSVAFVLLTTPKSWSVYENGAYYVSSAEGMLTLVQHFDIVNKGSR